MDQNRWRIRFGRLSRRPGILGTVDYLKFELKSLLTATGVELKGFEGRVNEEALVSTWKTAADRARMTERNDRASATSATVVQIAPASRQIKLAGCS
ncbi:hypothetical protein [Sphingopyxis sp. MSC1_008]|uniref:hypothetical protein n=1 Tax=Sphingopyxis sp. MSC1_008 TaxID=2909265 RepID=UPI0020BEB806|nr:hypothetical protein [Sphingopyxis sp. MSC1_008]